MTLPPYPALVALHVLAVGLFLSGLALAAETLPRLTRGEGPVDRHDLRRLRGLQRWLTTPALLLVWVLGLTMATEAGWFAMAWLQIKLVLVLALSGLHGWQLRTARRLAAGQRVPRVGYRPIAAIALLVTAIVVLVTVKPA